jgi:hypothetical protein
LGAVPDVFGNVSKHVCCMTQQPLEYRVCTL